MAALGKIVTEYTAKGANIIPGIVTQIIDKSGTRPLNFTIFTSNVLQERSCLTSPPATPPTSTMHPK